MNESDKLPVIVWLVSADGRSQSQREKVAAEKLAHKYPEAKKAIENSGKPMDVENPELAQQIHKEYVELMRENVDLSGAVISDLKRSGVQISPIDGMNAFAVVLPKSAILNLQKNSQVGRIFFNETLKRNEMDVASRTVRAAGVWGRGIDGSGVWIGILDPSNVDAANPFLDVSNTSRPGSDSDEHASDTASVAASFHDTYKGVAPGATIVSVGENGHQDDEIAALDWAFQHNVDVLNNSGGFEEDSNLHFTDTAFDKKARDVYRLIVKSAGNSGNFISSPGKAWKYSWECVDELGQ